MILTNLTCSAFLTIIIHLFQTAKYQIWCIVGWKKADALWDTFCPSLNPTVYQIGFCILLFGRNLISKILVWNFHLSIWELTGLAQMLPTPGRRCVNVKVEHCPHHRKLIFLPKRKTRPYLWLCQGFYTHLLTVQHGLGTKSLLVIA